jgi:hypothetical protein
MKEAPSSLLRCSHSELESPFTPNASSQKRIADHLPKAVRHTREAFFKNEAKARDGFHLTQQTFTPKSSTKMLSGCCNLIALPYSHAVDRSPTGELRRV